MLCIHLTENNDVYNIFYCSKYTNKYMPCPNCYIVGYILGFLTTVLTFRNLKNFFYKMYRVFAVQNGQTALQLAAVKGHLNIVKQLTKAGCPLDQTSDVSAFVAGLRYCNLTKSVPQPGVNGLRDIKCCIV